MVRKSFKLQVQVACSLSANNKLPVDTIPIAIGDQQMRVPLTTPKVTSADTHTQQNRLTMIFTEQEQRARGTDG